MLYTIWQRYEYWSNEGIKWTKWFPLFNVKPTGNKDELKEKLNYEKVGGAMLIGVNGVAVKAHGSSSAYSFSQAMEVCFNMINEKVLDLIKE